MMNWIINKIYHHFFEPAYIRDLSIIRIVVVSTQLTFLFLSVFGIAFGNSIHWESQKMAASLDMSEFSPVIILKVFLFPFGWGVRPEIMFLRALWLLAIFTGITSLFGIYKRVSLFIFASACTILVAHAYSYFEQHHTEALLILFLWVLVVGENSKTWSIDDLRRRVFGSYTKMKFEPRDKYETDVFARWPIRVMQWLFVLVYFSAGLEKVKGGFNYYSMMLSMGYDGLINDRSIALWLSQTPILLQIIAPVSVIFELSFGIIMLFPGLSWLYVLFGSMFHLSIYIVHGPPFLHYLALYVVFIEPIRNVWRKRMIRIKNRAKWFVIYDGYCPLCVRSVTVIDYLDTRKCLNYIDFENDWQSVESLNKDIKREETKHALHLVSPEGKIYKGFYAFQKLTLLQPLLLPLAPFVHIPFIDKAGDYVYQKISKNRKRVACSFDTCELY